jgi:hypothetical protein
LNPFFSSHWISEQPSQSASRKISTTINPANIRGFARDPSHTDGLMHGEFAAKCPPDVQPNTRIIAVCGISDIKGYASPVQDGWFLSDFYLFHYLLRATRKYTIT